MRKIGLFFTLMVCSCLISNAQSIIKDLESNVPGQGKVTIHQDPQVASLIGAGRSYSSSSSSNAGGGDSGERRVIKSSGYRIQAYAGNNTRQAKNDAYNVAYRLKEAFPELMVYTTFNPPRWLCRVGDFRSIEEADAMMRKMKATGMFKEVSIVRDQININL